MAYTEEELAGMTQEEREALKELEELEANASDDDPEVDLDKDKGDDNEGEDDGGDDQGDAGKAGNDNAAEGGDADDAGDDDGANGDEPEARHQAAPLFVAEAPADAEAQLQKISEDKAALVEKFDDGELTAKEYQQQLDALSKQERTIERAVDRAQLAADMENQRQANEREQAINGFLAEVGIPRDQSNLRFLTLDGAVRLVASNEENASLSPREILQKAYDLCIEQGTLQPKATKQGQQPEPQKEPRKPKKPIDAPKTLANVPAAEISDTDSARFAHISRIKDPDAREQAFAKLSPAEQDAYLAMGG